MADASTSTAIIWNVRVVFYDRKQMSMGTIAAAYEYYPFGMTLQSYGNAYRYGFNGKERDEENSEGTYDFGARIYDSRLGRFPSVDALVFKYPSESAYVFVGNSPITALDDDGKEKVVLSGHPGKHKGKTHFLENGLDRARKFKRAAGKEQVTWLIFQSPSTEARKDGTTFSKKQLDTYIKKATKYGIKVKIVASGDETLEYVNYKNGGLTRNEDRISDFAYLGHSSDTELLIGYQTTGKSDETLNIDDFQKGAMTENSNCNLVGGCRTGDDNWIYDNPMEDAQEVFGGTIKGSSVRVYYPGGVVSDAQLVKKNKGKILTLKGKGGYKNQTESEKEERNNNRPAKKKPSYAN